MKRLVIIGILLTLFVGSVAASVENAKSGDSITQYFEVGNPIKFGGEKFYFAYSARPYDFYMLQEYLPEGQDFDSYTSMFTVSVMFYGDAPFNSAKAVEYKIAELDEVKNTDKVCNYNVLENDGKYIIDFIVSKSDKDGNLEFVEVDIHYYQDIVINGINATYLLFYSTRAYGDNIMPFLESLPSRRGKWYEDITGLTVKPKFQFKK